MSEDHFFASAVNLNMHPIKKFKKKTKEQYFKSMKYFLSQTEMTEHIKCRLAQYQNFLEVENQEEREEQKNNSFLNEIVLCRFCPWRNKFKFWLICDIALIVIDYEILKKTVDNIRELVSVRQKKIIDELMRDLSGECERNEKKYFSDAEDLITQYKRNRKFFNEKEYTIIVTANMSAGKSTLINAIVGTDLARTSQEVCTGNLCYYYNKVFEDGNIHISGDHLDYASDYHKIKQNRWDFPVSVAVNFFPATGLERRLCIIDTPGVNSAVKREHGRIAKKCIMEEEYDVLLYVLNANKLGTDEEINYLKWISRNVSKDKVIFVLNKLDDFRTADDSIGASMNGVCRDLEMLGYEKPVVYPISAYFAYLVKKKFSGSCLSEDEEDEYSLYSKKFNKPEYNLVKYVHDADDIGDGYQGMLKKSGLYTLEQLIYGGAL